MMEVLHFSGGRDSIATLWVLKKRWPHMTVMWCNTGAAYPDTMELMAKVKALVPHFMEVKSNQPETIKLYGYPADIVPLHSTLNGQSITSVKGTRFQSSLDCCARNLWIPIVRATQELGAKIIYRGQRREEEYRIPINSGHVDENGVTYVFPIQEWSEQKVRDYIMENCPQLWPDYYDEGEVTSHDCWDCTGWLDVSVPRINRLPPEQKVIVMERLRALDGELKREAQPLRQLLEDKDGSDTVHRSAALSE